MSKKIDKKLINCWQKPGKRIEKLWQKADKQNLLTTLEVWRALENQANA